MKSKSFNLKLTEADHATLFSKSKAAGISATEFLRRCIRGEPVTVFPVGPDIVKSFKEYLKTIDDSKDELNWEEPS